MLSEELDEFVLDLAYLRAVCGYLNEVLLSVCGAVVIRMDADEIFKLIWPDCPGNLPVLQDVLLKLNFRVTVSHTFICWQKYADNWTHGRILVKSYSALDDLKI